MINPSPKASFPTLGQCAPISVAAAGTVTTGGTYLQIPAGATKLKCTLMVGTVGSTPTHALSAVQATTSGGTGSKAVSGITATFGTVAGTTLQVDFDLPTVLDIQGGFNFIQLTITNNSGSASLMAAEFETNAAYLA